VENKWDGGRDRENFKYFISFELRDDEDDATKPNLIKANK
jgi:hypothetical protein